MVIGIFKKLSLKFFNGGLMQRELIIEELSKIVGKGNVLFSETDLLLYGYDASLFKGKPDCIAFPG